MAITLLPGVLCDADGGKEQAPFQFEEKRGFSRAGAYQDIPEFSEEFLRRISER
jgi:hypothetical protein